MIAQAPEIQFIMIGRLINKHFFAVKVNIEILKRIRQETSAPLSQCKTALEETQNSYEKALEWLKKKGMSVAQKHADKSTREGVIAGLLNPRRDTGIMLEVNCQTDFVAKNELFLRFVNKLLHSALQSPDNNISLNNIQKQQENVKATESMLQQMPAMRVFDDTCKNALEEKKILISKVQENVRVRRVLKIHNPKAKLGLYVHRQYQSGIGLQGCIAELIPEKQNPQPQELFNEFCDNISTQLLGSPPRYFSESQVPEPIINEERVRIMAQMAVALARAPPDSHTRIIAGKLKSTLFEPYVLPYMGYILSSSGEMTVGEYWKSVEHELQTKIRLGRTETWKCK